MPKIITRAHLTIDSSQNPSLYVSATVLMPAGEYAAFIVLAGLTSAVPAHVSAFIAARLAAGTSSGQ